jgi:hypothetical protein
MNMVSFETVIVWFILILKLSGISSAKDHPQPPIEEYLTEGLVLVEKFYNHLSLGEFSEDLEDIFEPGLLGNKEPREYFEFPEWRWTELFKNDKLFVPKSYWNGENRRFSQFFERSNKSLFLYNLRESEDFNSRRLVYIVVTGNMPSSSGALKHIMFPIVWVGHLNEFRIAFHGIAINGAFFDPTHEFKRDSDLFRDLGFIKD